MSKTKKMVIKAKDIKVSIGHRQHTTGTGVHEKGENFKLPHAEVNRMVDSGSLKRV